jgi:hypothetical protein
MDENSLRSSDRLGQPMPLSLSSPTAWHGKAKRTALIGCRGRLQCRRCSDKSAGTFISHRLTNTDTRLLGAYEISDYGWNRVPETLSARAGNSLHLKFNDGDMAPAASIAW